MSNKRTFDNLYTAVDDDDDSPPSPFEEGRRKLCAVSAPPRPIPTPLSVHLALFDTMRKDDQTFFGCIPQDINGLIRPILAHRMTCVVCTRDIPGPIRAEQEIGFAMDQIIKGHVCTRHDQCHKCFTVFSTHKAPGPLYLYTWNQYNKNGQPMYFSEIVTICPTCHPKCSNEGCYKIQTISDLFG